MIGIYKITGPAGRVYIRQSVDIKLRKKSYENYKCKEQTRLYNSLVKYGFSAHIFEIIEECKVEDLNIRERYWQEHYRVLGPEGLNCRLTDTKDKSGILSEDHKKAISKALTGRTRVFTAEHRENLRKAALKRNYALPSRKGKTGSMYGKKHSEESINKMKKPKEKVECPYCKKVGGISQMKRYHFEKCKRKVG